MYLCTYTSVCTRTVDWSQLTNYLHAAEPFFRGRQLCSYSRTSQNFVKTEGSLPCSQEPSTGVHTDSTSHAHMKILSVLAKHSLYRKQRLSARSWSTVYNVRSRNILTLDNLCGNPKVHDFGAYTHRYRRECNVLSTRSLRQVPFFTNFRLRPCFVLVAYSSEIPLSSCCNFPKVVGRYHEAVPAQFCVPCMQIVSFGSWLKIDFPDRKASETGNVANTVWMT
jgi:hypothetical protein